VVSVVVVVWRRVGFGFVSASMMVVVYSCEWLILVVVGVM
jgi:hypothetical protein